MIAGGLAGNESEENTECSSRGEGFQPKGHLMEDERNGLLTAEGLFLPLQCRLEKPKNPWAYWA